MGLILGLQSLPGFSPRWRIENYFGPVEAMDGGS